MSLDFKPVFFSFHTVSAGFIQQGNVVAGQPRPNHIITRPQMPGAPMQWIQQQVSEHKNRFTQIPYRTTQKR